MKTEHLSTVIRYRLEARYQGFAGWWSPLGTVPQNTLREARKMRREYRANNIASLRKFRTRIVREIIVSDVFPR
jgi:hypothetical protein